MIAAHDFTPLSDSGGRTALRGDSEIFPKGWDLRRDPRCAIHALPGPDDDELSIRARAREVGDDPGVRELVVGVVMLSAVGGMIETTSVDLLFEFDLVRVDTAKWLGIGKPGTHAERQHWMAPG